jgi:hypothetical protein
MNGLIALPLCLLANRARLNWLWEIVDAAYEGRNAPALQVKAIRSPWTAGCWDITNPEGV